MGREQRVDVGRATRAGTAGRRGADQRDLGRDRVSPAAAARNRPSPVRQVPPAFEPRLARRAGSRQRACRTSSPLRTDVLVFVRALSSNDGQAVPARPPAPSRFSGLSVRERGAGSGAGVTDLSAAVGMVGPGASPVDGLALRAGSASPGTARRWALRVGVSGWPAFRGRVIARRSTTE
jgi:hypothetical protein